MYKVIIVCMYVCVELPIQDDCACVIYLPTQLIDKSACTDVEEINLNKYLVTQVKAHIEKTYDSSRKRLFLTASTAFVNI